MMIDCDGKSVILAVVMMLLGGLVMVQGPPYYYFYGGSGIPYPSSPHRYEEVLSNESSRIVISNIDTSRVILRQLSTNGSSVTIYAVSNSRGVFANFTDIRVIGSDGLAFEDQYEYWNLTISRQDQDVEITFEIVFWFPPPIPEIAMIAVTPWFVYGAALFFLSTYYLMRTENTCHRHTPRDRRHILGKRKASHITLLVILALVLTAPLIYGYTHRHIQPVSRLQLETQDYEYDISSESLGVIIDIFDIAPRNRLYLQITFGNFCFEGVAHFRIFTESMTLLNILTVHPSQNFGIEMSFGNETAHILEIYLEESQESIAFTVTLGFYETSSDWNPIIPISLAAMALVPAILALTQAKELADAMNQISSAESTASEPTNQ
ncbi:MAG: hypothetical protein ACFFEJ_02755 [Candidatus Thorarchaeota archaeon]